MKIFTLLTIFLASFSVFAEGPKKKQPQKKQELKQGEVPVSPTGNTHIELGESSLWGESDRSSTMEIVTPTTEIMNNKVKGRKHFNDRSYMDVINVK